VNWWTDSDKTDPTA